MAVWKETTDELRRYYFFIQPPILTIIVIALLNHTLAIFILAYSVLNENSNVLGCAYNEEWYIERFIDLTRTILTTSGEYPDHLSPHDFFDKYIEWINGRSYSPEKIEETFTYGKAEKKQPDF